MSESPAASPAPATSGELIAALSGLLLLIAMIALKWFGITGPDGRFAPRSGTLATQTAWQSLTTLRWLMVVTIAVALAAGVLRLTQRDHDARTDVSLLVAALGGLTAVLLTYRVLIELPGSGSVVDQKLGAFLGLLAAIGIAFGGLASRHEARLARGRSPGRKDRQWQQEPSSRRAS